MKNFALLVGVALLASCGAKKDAAAPDAMATADSSMPMDAGASPTVVPSHAPGSYDVTDADGTKSVTTMMADGSYVDRDSKDKVIAKGKTAVKGDKMCFMPEGKPEECYTETAVAADGSFTATGADGKTSTIKPHVKM